MRILVTGGAGFIGGHLCKLLAKERALTVLDVKAEAKDAPVGQYYWKLDCRDLPGEKNCYDFVYHLAATVGVANVLRDPRECMDNNIESLKAVLGLGVPGMFFSTSEVYGKTSGPLREDSAIQFTSKVRWSYAASKLIGEWMALQAGWKAIRPFNVVGPRQSTSYGAVLPTFVRQALAGEPITVYGDGSQVRTFIDVRDFVEIVDRLRDMDFEVCNVGGPHAMTILELAEKVKAVLGSRSEIRRVPYEKAYTDGFEECRERVPDLSRMKALAGEVRFRQLTDTIQDLAKHLEGETACLSGQMTR